MDRPKSGKGERYELAKKKYEMFQSRQDKLSEMDNILTVSESSGHTLQGKQNQTIVPKPGEFMIVSTDKKFDPSQELSLGLDELLDSARQTITNRVESGRKTNKSQLTGGAGRGNSMASSSNMNQQRSTNSLHRGFNPHADDQILSSISSQPQLRFPIGQLGGGLKSSNKLPSEYQLQSARDNDSVLDKQALIAQNPDMKSSMTTSIRNIMRKQDKELLTQSSRLLHSQLEAFDEQMKIRQQTIQNEALSSLELLQNKLQDQQKLSGKPPVMLPSLSKSGFGMNSDVSQGAASSSYGGGGLQNAQSMKGLSRPGSAYVFFGGDKDTIKQAKSRINLKSSRQRDLHPSSSHSYKPQPLKYQLEKVKDASVASHIKVPPLPSLVLQQQAMNKELNPASPFLEERSVSPMIIHEDNPRVTHSPVHERMYREIEERQRQRGESPLKYSYNVDKIKALRHQSESPRKEGAKGTNADQKKKTQGGGSKFTQMEQEILRKKFLPIDAYDPMIDTEDPHKAITDFVDPVYGQTFARSKWFFANGEFEMRDCEVLGYDDKEELYDIKWLGNDQTKKVSRFNLIFNRENHEIFRKRIEEAKRHREDAELIMKYYYMIQHTKTAKYEMSDDQKTRISYFIKSFRSQQNVVGKKFRDPEEFLSRDARGMYEIPKSLTNSKPSYADSVDEIHREFLVRRYNLHTLATLFKELDQDYTRAHKQVVFDSQLPYSTEKYNLFKTILPRYKFVPVSERIVGETDLKGLIDIPERSIPFRDLLQVMKIKLHQANQDKLDSLMRVSQNMIKLSPMCFFRLSFREAQSKEMFIKNNRLQSGEVLREVRNCMFDSQYEIHSMIAKETKRIYDINFQRKQASSFQSKAVKEEIISDQFKEDMSQFQILLNNLYERSIRSCYENSVETFIKGIVQVTSIMNDSIKKDIRSDPITEENIMTLANDPVLAKRNENKFQFKISVVFNKESGMIELQPPFEEWIQDIFCQINYNIEELSLVPCFSANEIGLAREEGKVKIFEIGTDPFIIEKLQVIHDLLEVLFKVPQATEAIVTQYSSILATDIKKFKHEYKVNDYPIETYKSILEQNQSALKHMNTLLFDSKINCGLFQFKYEKLKTQFENRVNDLNKVLFECIKKKIDQTNALIETEVINILATINKDPIEDIEELTDIATFIANLDKKMSVIKALIADVMGKMGLLEEYQYKLSEEEFYRTWISFSKPLDIFQAEHDCKRRMKGYEREFFQALRVMNEKLAQDFESIKIDFEIVQRCEEFEEYEDAGIKTDLLHEKIEQAIHISIISNRREELFKLKTTDYTEIEKLRAAFAPYYTLWNLARDYKYKQPVWMSGPLTDIDRDKITIEITEACTTLIRLERVDFKEKRIIAIVCGQVRKAYESFKPYLPLIIALRNPTLKMRHWENIQKLKTPPLEVEHELHCSINDLIDRGVMAILEDITDISEIASREKKLEDAIQKMRDEWRNIKFELAPFRDSGTFVLKGAEPIWDVLDDHIMKTMTIAASPYVKFLASEVNFWKQTLIKVQEILEEWMKVQRGWLYLWPIFSSEDIQKQMPIISASFLTVDKIWRNQLANTQSNPNVLDTCLAQRVFENFQSCNDMIDRIQKGLNEYLNTKRVAFPRFFFLSNDDLLHILSQTKDPLRVQDHLNKCFEGIDKLEFDGDKRIQGMYSVMGEFVKFVSQIDPFKRDSGDVRNVEDWLTDVETQMRDSLRDQVKQCGASYSKEKRSQWIFDWSSNIILTLDQVFWTTLVEVDGISNQKKDKTAMKKVFQEEEAKLQELVTLIKVPRSNQCDLLTLGALIVLDVHSKDVTKDLALAQIEDVAAFEWISQLRYYVIDEPITNKNPNPLLEINVKMVNSTRLYGFEYLGNQTRLVITPLTDRCYRTLMGALQLNLGGAPEGPAGTGKTETTKDLAKAVAKQCIVFNCSDQLDVQAMAKFFKGLACCGAWACFDEFNRIELEVLSVIAQQILTIQSALMRRRANTPFQFEDDTIMMNPSCAVFITMNPGYAGRSELPDNLKALFRPVAMMIPNYAMIAEISLYSFGFQNARELSVKITQSLRLASEQLSTQSHYDYGMRAVKSIIMAAGGLKRDYPEEDEYRLTLRAISDCNIPKFITEDIPLFEGIISDLFPTTDKSKPNYDVLMDSIHVSMTGRNLAQSPEFETKTIQLFETVQVRHGLMMVGAIMSAKTQVVHTLAQALTLVSKNSRQSEEDPIEKVVVNTMNPKSISIGKLYGDFDKVSHDWSDGVLATVIKDCAQDKSGNRRWILLDGPVDAVWIENLNTVLDDNKKLCLSSGEIVKFTPKMTMMFEVEDLLVASPATVSRCGMVFLNPERLGWNVMVQPWLNSLPQLVKHEGRSDIYKELIDFFVPQVVGFLFGFEQTVEEEKRLEGLKTVIQVTKNWSFRSFIAFFESLLMKTDTRDSLVKKEQEIKDKEEAKKQFDKIQGITTDPKKNQKEAKLTPEQKTEIFSFFMLALTWGFGSPLHQLGRYSFSDFLQTKVSAILKEPTLLTFGDELVKTMILDESHDYFSCVYSMEKQGWIRWDHEIDKNDIFGKKSSESQDDDFQQEEIEFSSIMIPTEDTIRYSFILDILAQHSFPVIFMGETGTGKTSAIKKYQNSTLQKDQWELGQMVLSATSGAHHVQEFIQSKVDKHRKGVYGPKTPGKRLFIFLDDLNMPAKEKYGAQPPIEILRQTIDNGGFYDLKTNELIKIVDVLFVAAMGIPGGGKTLPSKRLMRHFNLIHIPPYSSDNLFRIFSKILEWGYQKYTDVWQKQHKTIAKLTIALYEKAVQVFLPLPSKSHYLFNLRQVSEIIQGMLMVPHQRVALSDNKLGLIQKLWIHESTRVFSDRLIDEADKNLFSDTIKDVVASVQPNFIDFDKVNIESIIFSNFVEFNPADPQYQESQGPKQMKKVIGDILDFFNATSKQKMSLLLFDYVIQHLSRISRIIFKPYGNGLLIGIGGNGRRSLSRLASFINECYPFKIEMSKTYGRYEWSEDMKALYKMIGLDNKKVVFTFQDTDIKQEFFIEDINNILNVGEVPNIFTQDEMEEIRYEVAKTIPKRQQVGDLYDMFLRRSKQNLHLLLFMSPAGSRLRQYIRQYPSLVNCTSIDWFFSWPEEALETVSKHFLAESQLFVVKRPNVVKRKKILDMVQEEEGETDKSNIEIKPSAQIEGEAQPYSEEQFENIEEDLPVEDVQYNDQIIELQNKVASIFVSIHNSTLEVAAKYVAEKNRQIYITPTRFIEIFQIFAAIMKRKHSQIDEERNKYLIGIQKLEEANVMVDQMKEQLQSLKPELEVKSKQVEETMIRLDKESKEVEAVKEVVDSEAQIVFAQKEEAQGIKNECEASLSLAQPLLDEALRALNTLKPNDFVTMKSYNQPPQPIRLALEAVCIMLGITPKYVEVQNKTTKKNEKVPDYWEKSKKLLNDYKKFLKSLIEYEKDTIPEDRINKIQEYLNNPKFVPEEIKKASEAAEGICKWVRAICKYDVVAKEIRPKRHALSLANEKLDVVVKQLQIKEAQLQELVDKKNKLEEEFKSQNYEKQHLIMQRDECQAKLNRASVLMNSLGAEKERWLKTAERLGNEKESLLGDVILSTAFLTYLGPFEQTYRDLALMKHWRNIVSQNQILVAETFSLSDIIGNPSALQAWQLKGLPQDSVSIENMIIMTENQGKWPMIIDPQGQALKFLKDLIEQDFVSIKVLSENYSKKLEPALSLGQTVICEGMGENIDPSINAVIVKEIIEIQGEKYIKFNDNQVEYDTNFKFYMVSNLSNPHFSPEIQTRTLVLNFSITKVGLEQQLLSIVCKHEAE